MAKATKSTKSTLLQTIKDIETKARLKAEQRLIDSLGTEKGSNRFLKNKDGKILEDIVTSIEDVTGKPMFHGFTFSSNVELIVAIASALQFMKGNLRELVSESLYKIFDGDTRDEILIAYGRLPYAMEDTIVNVDGEEIIIDPLAKQRARDGIKAEVADLASVVSSVALELGLLGEYSCTQAEANSAWFQAMSKIDRQDKMEEYKASLSA